MPRKPEFQEGIDYEWRDSGRGYKTRHFFTSAEKNARAAGPRPKSAPKPTGRKPSRKSGPKATPLKAPAEVTTTPLGANTGLAEDIKRLLDGMDQRGSQKRGPSTFQERAEATVSKTRRRPLGVSQEAVRERRAYDRLKEEGTLGPARVRTPGSRGRAQRRSQYNKGGLVRANCGASMKAKGKR